VTHAPDRVAHAPEHRRRRGRRAAEAGPGLPAAPAFDAMELALLDLPGVVPGMSRPELLEQLAKLREQGDLSGNEHGRVLRSLGLA